MFESHSAKGRTSASPVRPPKPSGVRSELNRQDYLAVAHEVAELVGGACLVHFVSQEGEYLEPFAWYREGGGPLPSDLVASTHARVGEGVLGNVMASGAAKRKGTLTLEEASLLPCKASLLTQLAPSGKLSLLSVPIYDAGEVVGTCSVLKEHGGRPYTKQDQVLVEALVQRSARVRRIYEKRGQTGQKKHEQAKREQAGGVRRVGEQDFRSMLDAARVLIWVGGTSRRCSYCNERWLAFTGRSLNEEIGDGWLESVHPDDRDPFISAYVDASRHWSPFSAEFRLRRSDGVYRWVRCHGNPRFVSDGSFTGYVGVCTDITERRRFEEELVRISKAVEGASDAIYITNQEGRSIYHNRAFLDLIGYATDELNAAGGPAAMFAHPEIAYEAFADVQQGGSWSGEVELQGQNARAVPVFMRVDAIRDQDERIIGLMGICTDVTERKMAQEVVKESVGLFQATFEQAAVGVAQVSADGGILQVNQKLCHILGYDGAELVGMNLQALDPFGEDKELPPSLARFLAGEADTHTQEKQIARQDGSLVWINEVASWVRDAEHRPKYLIVVVQDISDRKQSEQALKESEERLALMLQQTPAIIWSTDEEMQMTRLMGAGLQARTGQTQGTPGTPAALLHARQLEEPLFEVPPGPQRQALGGESVQFEMKTNGRVYQSRIEPFRDVEGIVKGVIGIATDVTEHRHMHDALTQSEERYRSFVTTISEAIWCYELDVPLPVNLSVALQVRHIYQNARMVECNDIYAREMAGKPQKEVIGQRIRDLFALLPERFQFLSTFIRSGYTIQNQRYSDLDAQGKRRHYVANVVGILENDRLVRIWGSRVDATETVDMERRMLNALEEQQQRIGHDLHDSVGQLLTAVRMLSEQLSDELESRDERGAGLAGKIASFAQDALQQTRRVYRGLAPMMLQTEGLLTTLHDLAHNLDTLPDVSCTFTCNTDTEMGDPDTWIHIYRIMQEGAHNAIKHGHCENLELSLTWLKDKIVLGVRDDGQGFNPDTVKGGGLGLSGMQYRAHLIGAMLEIDSSPGEGTTLTCSIPLEGFQKAAKK